MIIDSYDGSRQVAAPFVELFPINRVDEQNCIILVAPNVFLSYIPPEIADQLSDVFREVEGPGLDDVDLIAFLEEPVHEGVWQGLSGAIPDERRTGKVRYY